MIQFEQFMVTLKQIHLFKFLFVMFNYLDEYNFV